MRNIGAGGTWEAVTSIPICKSRLCEGDKQAFLVCHKSVCHMFRWALKQANIENIISQFSPCIYIQQIKSQPKLTKRGVNVTYYLEIKQEKN